MFRLFPKRPNHHRLYCYRVEYILQICTTVINIFIFYFLDYVLFNASFGSWVLPYFGQNDSTDNQTPYTTMQYIIIVYFFANACTLLPLSVYVFCVLFKLKKKLKGETDGREVISFKRIQSNT